MGSHALKLRDSARPSPELDRRRFDLFVAAPMAGHESRLAFQESQAAVMKTIDDLISAGTARRIYYAGAAIGHAEPFTPHDSALDEDLGALTASSKLLLIYPAKLATGALVELGYAMALKRPAAILVRDFDDLPYFLRHLRGMQRPSVSGPVTVCRYNGDDDLSNCARAALNALAQC